MAFAINRGNALTQTNVIDCAPVTCAVCGGLECLCRPRFFAGQLLTDEDLQRLDHYITAKNKLHNRYLIGWGVACGLEVVCNACDGTVTVRPGYALSPCGDDIIVCADTAVDVCSMIQKCRKKMPRDCQPNQLGGVDPCSEATETWILAICYDEKPSRGLVPLKNTGSAACCSRCACGGSSSCSCGGTSSGGCGCGGHGSGNGNGNGKSNGCSCGTKSQTRQTATAQAQCEPTVICEGYHFEVCKITGNEIKRSQLGAITQRFWCCLLKLGELFAQFPASDNQQDVKSWCCSIRDSLLEFTAENPGYDCALAQRIANMCQSDDSQQIGNDVARLVLEYIQYCFCSALLPPCPPPSRDNCVPLATLTVSRKNAGCSIQRVCNIEARKFLVDLPNLGYWLSWIPFGAGLRRIFAGFCCNEVAWERTAFRPQVNAIGVENVRAARAVNEVAAPNPSADFMSLIFESASNRERKVDMQALTMAMLGMTDIKNNHNLNELELKYPFESIFINQIGRPLVQSFLGGMGNIRGAGGSTGGQDTTGFAPAAPQEKTESDAQTQIDALKKQMETMRQDLKRSQDQIEKLSKRKKDQ
jgi:hypothetical protein